MNILGILDSLILMGVSGWGLYAMTLADQPFGYTASAFAFVHGTLTLVHAIQENSGGKCMKRGSNMDMFSSDSDGDDWAGFGDGPAVASKSHVLSLSKNVMETIPLPLANIEIYLASSYAGAALVHGLSLILLFYDTMGSMCSGTDKETAIVKDIAMAVNIASASFLGIEEENYFHLGIAAAALLSRYGPTLAAVYLPSAGPLVNTIGKSTLLGLMTYSLTQNATSRPKEEHGVTPQSDTGSKKKYNGNFYIFGF